MISGFKPNLQNKLKYILKYYCNLKQACYYDCIDNANGVKKMKNLEEIKAAAEKYLENEENYPEDTGEMWYISYGGWNTGKRAHPATLGTDAVETVFGGNLWGNYNHYNVREDGWQSIKSCQISVVHSFIKSNLKITEKELDRLLFDHGLKLSKNTECGAEEAWLKLERFGKVLDWYAVGIKDEKTERMLSKISILLDETGYKLEDFILWKK